MRSPIVNQDFSRLHAIFGRDFLAGQRILITGASGMIGGYLLDALASFNEQSAAPDRLLVAQIRQGEKFRHRLPHLDRRPDIVLLEGDLAVDDLAIPPVNIIIHAASAAAPRHYLADPIGSALVNGAGCQRLLEAASRHEATFLFLSSGAVYGDGSGSETIGESDFGPADPLAARACYGESKRYGEMLCAAYHRQRGVRAMIARISHTFGPGLDLDDGRVFADFLRALIEDAALTVTGNPDDSRPFCYLGDTIEGLLRILRDGAAGEAYNLGSDQEIAIGDLARALERLNPRCRTVLAPRDAPTGSAAPRASGHFAIDKLRRLGWSPRLNAVQAFARTLAHYRPDLSDARL